MVTYNNADLDKSRIYEENKRKSSIYKFRIYYSSKAMENKLNNGSNAIYGVIKYDYLLNI
jgi:hypothetical protein